MTLEAPQQDHVPVKELEVSKNYILTNALRIHGEGEEGISIYIEPGTSFKVKGVQHTPLLYFLDFNGVTLSMVEETLRNCHIVRA